MEKLSQEQIHRIAERAARAFGGLDDDQIAEVATRTLVRVLRRQKTAEVNSSYVSIVADGEAKKLLKKLANQAEREIEYGNRPTKTVDFLPREFSRPGGTEVWRQFQRLILEGLASDTQKKVLLLRLRGYNQEEIGQMLKMSERRVSRTIKEAGEMIQRLWSK